MSSFQHEFQQQPMLELSVDVLRQRLREMETKCWNLNKLLNTSNAERDGLLEIVAENSATISRLQSKLDYEIFAIQVERSIIANQER